MILASNRVTVGGFSGERPGPWPPFADYLEALMKEGLTVSKLANDFDLLHSLHHFLHFPRLLHATLGLSLLEAEFFGMKLPR